MSKGLSHYSVLRQSSECSICEYGISKLQRMIYVGCSPSFHSPSFYHSFRVSILALAVQVLALSLLSFLKLSPSTQGIMGCLHSVPNYRPARTRVRVARKVTATPYNAPLGWENNPNYPLYIGGGYGVGGGGAWPKNNGAHFPGSMAWQGRLGQGGGEEAGPAAGGGHGGTGNGGGNRGSRYGGSRHGGSRHGSHAGGGFDIASQHSGRGTEEAIQIPHMPPSHLFYPTNVVGSTHPGRHNHGPANHHGSRQSHQTREVSRQNARGDRPSRNSSRHQTHLDFDAIEEFEEESDEEQEAGNKRRKRAPRSSTHGSSRHPTRRTPSHRASSRHASPPGGNGRFGGGHHGTRVARGPATVANDSEDDDDD